MAIRWAYFDTSVLVKRYVREEGSLTAGDLMRRHRILSSAIAPVEALSAFSRRRAAAQLSDDDFRLVVARIRADRHHWELVGLTHTVLSRAEQVIGTAGVRTLDALHIACALVFQEMSATRVAFITADARQREAAQQMALDVTWLSTAS